ncbi:MAG: RNA 2',3'-cyclic phosphodiesterase [Xanthomonadales bacterium]|nr:RNA 2',3'-cyclic phosphodiesterase [Xanthomonadales bacterium]
MNPLPDDDPRVTDPADEGRLRERYNLFFALRPDPDTRAAIAAAAAALAGTAPAGRWIKPERYHLTLRFLGEYDRPPAEAIRLAAAAADAIEGTCFDLLLDRAGSFGRRRATCWLGCGAVPTALAELVGCLDRALAASLGAAPSPRFVPHVTILRDAARPFSAALPDPVSWSVREFVLIESRIDSPAPHRAAGRWPLR